MYLAIEQTGGLSLGDAAAIQALGKTGDPSYVSVLAELLRFPWLLSEEVRDAIYSSLARLGGSGSGQLSAEQRDWDWWMVWLGNHPEVKPPDGYDGWKGRLYSTIVNPETGAFFHEGVKHRIRLEEIVWGGVPKDGIPDLMDPPVVTAQDATYMNPKDRVFGVSFNGQHRAYPLRILNAHEMANDTVGDVPFSLAY